MQHASFSLGEFKALSGKDEPGTFEALVSVFGNVDYGGDRVQRGAFKRTLAEWAAKGRSIPVLWSHDSETVPIGVVGKASESNNGLRVKATLFVEDNPLARSVYAAMKGGALQEFSFGYGVKDSKDTVEGGQQVRILKDLDLFEVSPVFRGMNPATSLLAVKKAMDVTEEIKTLRLRLDELEAQVRTQLALQEQNDLQTQIADNQKRILELTKQDSKITDDVGQMVNGWIGEKIGTKLQPEATEEQPVATDEEPPDPAGETEDPVKPAQGEQEPNDNPQPNPPDGGEEAAARIRALQAEKPIHLE